MANEAGNQITAVKPKRNIFAFISVWVSGKLDPPKWPELRNFASNLEAHEQSYCSLA